MMDVLREWLLRIVGSAFLMTAVSVLTPKGAVKRIELLCCSVILMLAVLHPFTGGELPEIPELSHVGEKIRHRTDEFRKTGQESWESLIEEELVSYIETRAAEEGISCAVDISFEINDDGVPLPVAVELTAPQRSEEVHRSVREDLGIAEENIRWRIG